MRGWTVRSWLLPEDEDWRWLAVTDATDLPSVHITMLFTERLFLVLREEETVFLTLCDIPGVTREDSGIVVDLCARSEVESRLSWAGVKADWRIERLAEFASVEALWAFKQAMEGLTRGPPQV